MKLVEIVGRRFGQLVATSRQPDAKCGRPRWHCVCDCGSDCVVTTASLRSGNTTSCGCKKANTGDLTGRVFGRLTVLSEVQRRTIKGCRRWTCTCSCGRTIQVRSRNLQHGTRTCCGCARTTRLYSRKPDRDVLVARMRNTYTNNARNRGYSFHLADSDIARIIGQDCHYCGAPPTPHTSKSHRIVRTLFYNGMDRMDNTRGYTVRNTVACCSRCNYMKSSTAYHDFIDAARAIAAKHPHKVNYIPRLKQSPLF
jgi:hypothetical protein